MINTTLEDKYIKYSIIHRQASDEGKFRIANHAYHILSSIYKRISIDTEYAEYFLKIMLHHEDIGVELWAATHSLGLLVNVELAVQTLRKISRMNNVGIIRLSAEMTLSQWEKNKLIVK